MAEAEHSDKNTPTPQRRPHHQNRPSSSHRGRGRANASVSKAMHFFGVKDLREILDRKHQDQEAKGGPPPDPSYNYLKDPSRENPNDPQGNKYHKEHSERVSGNTQPRGYYSRGRGRGRGGGTQRENRHSESEKPTFIHNPVNIKVEVVASTGERNCKLDEETKLPDIKRIPNYKLKDLRPSKTDGGGGRDYADRHRNERGRGRGQRGRRGRGRGGRGGGRGYSNRNNENEADQSPKPKPPEVASEENWDSESVETLQNPSVNEEEKESRETHEEDYGEEPEGHENDYQEEYYEEGKEEEYADAAELNQPLNTTESVEESTGDDRVKIDENLVITSSENEEKRKRTVQFKLENQQNEEASKEAVEAEKSSTEEKSKKEGEEQSEPVKKDE